MSEENHTHDPPNIESKSMPNEDPVPEPLRSIASRLTSIVSEDTDRTRRSESVTTLDSPYSEPRDQFRSGTWDQSRGEAKSVGQEESKDPDTLAAASLLDLHNEPGPQVQSRPPEASNEKANRTGHEENKDPDTLAAASLLEFHSEPRTRVQPELLDKSKDEAKSTDQEERKNRDSLAATSLLDMRKNSIVHQRLKGTNTSASIYNKRSQLNVPGSTAANRPSPLRNQWHPDSTDGEKSSEEDNSKTTIPFRRTKRRKKKKAVEKHPDVNHRYCECEKCTRPKIESDDSDEGCKRMVVGSEKLCRPCAFACYKGEHADATPMSEEGLPSDSPVRRRRKRKR